jgi:hypothetical protein
VAALAVSALSGCASMSADECALSDWRAVGYEDGSRGYTADQFGSRRKACAKHGISADFDAYQDGRRSGLVDYCQPGRGFQVGAAGGSYYGVCEASLEPAFLESFRVGRELYRLRSAVNSSYSALAGHEAELSSIEAQIRDTQAALIARETSTEDRVLLLADLKELSERKGAVETEIQTLIAEHAAAEVELANYETQVAAQGF